MGSSGTDQASGPRILCTVPSSSAGVVALATITSNTKSTAALRNQWPSSRLHSSLRSQRWPKALLQSSTEDHNGPNVGECLCTCSWPKVLTLCLEAGSSPSAQYLINARGA